MCCRLAKVLFSKLLNYTSILSFYIPYYHQSKLKCDQSTGHAEAGQLSKKFMIRRSQVWVLMLLITAIYTNEHLMYIKLIYDFITWNNCIVIFKWRGPSFIQKTFIKTMTKPKNIYNVESCNSTQYSVSSSAHSDYFIEN